MKKSIFILLSVIILIGIINCFILWLAKYIANGTNNIYFMGGYLLIISILLILGGGVVYFKYKK